MPPAGGMLFNLMEVGPDVVTGGPFGPEGGLAVTIILNRQYWGSLAGQ